MAPTPVSVTRRIKTRALELGFDAAGVAPVTPGADTVTAAAADRFETWLATGHHAGMVWLAGERSRARRADPSLLLPGARSMVCVALCHEPERDTERDARLGRIARYAAGEDYHRVMRDRLGALAGFIGAALPGARAVWHSDTGAILEREWARRAGLGWPGRHSGLISPTLGSYLLLGEVLVDHELEADPPFERDRCGDCTRCIEACPTGAIVAPGVVDARRCISNLTVEHRGSLPEDLRPRLGDRVFGCDACQEVCPWNRFAPPPREERLRARAYAGWSLERFSALDEDGFRALFATSAVRRARHDGFLRNVRAALANRGR